MNILVHLTFVPLCKFLEVKNADSNAYLCKMLSDVVKPPTKNIQPIPLHLIVCENIFLVSSTLDTSFSHLMGKDD